MFDRCIFTCTSYFKASPLNGTVNGQVLGLLRIERQDKQETPTVELDPRPCKTITAKSFQNVNSRNLRVVNPIILHSCVISN